MNLAIIPFARETFDFGLAQQKHLKMVTALKKLGHETFGGNRLITSTDIFKKVLDELVSWRPDHIVVYKLHSRMLLQLKNFQTALIVIYRYGL